MRGLLPLVFLLAFAVPALALDEIPAAPIELTQIEPWFPALASDGENYFAVWSDLRDVRRAAVYGARITPDRQVLDPVGLRLLEGHDTASIAYGLGRYFILGQSLRFVILDREARVVARGTVANEHAAARAQVLFNGSDFVAFWSNDTVRTATVDPFGNMVRRPENVVSDQPLSLHSAATDGSRILVTYTHEATLYVAGTSLTGERLWADRMIADGVGWGRFASSAFARGEFAVAWIAADGVRTMRLDADGNPQAPSQLAIPPPVTAVHLIATTDGFRLLGQQELRVMSYTLTNELVPVTATAVIDLEPSNVVGDFTVAQGPGGTMVLASFGPSIPYSPFGLYAAHGDTPEAPVLVSRAGTTQTEPDVAIGDDGTLAVWNERERPHIGATFFAANGTSRTFDVVANGRHPSVATQGRAYIVTWTGPGGARARVIRDGFLIGDEIPLNQTPGAIVAATTEGLDFIVAAAPVVTNAPVQLWRITDVGDVVSQGTVDVSPGSRASEVDVACDRGECLAVWVEHTLQTACLPGRCIVSEQVMAVPFDSALRPRYRLPITLTERSTNARTPHFAVAAFDGSYAVTWRTVDGIVTARTITEGQQLGTVFTLPGDHVAVERDGNAWLLVREVNKELVTSHFTASTFDPGAPLARDAQWRSAPALARNGEKIVIAYERTTIGEAAGGVVRAYVAALPPSAAKRRTARH